VRRLWVAAAAALLALGTGLWMLARDTGPTTHTYVVAAGSGERLDAGEDLELFPRRLEVVVGDRLVIRNEDARVHTVGPYTVGPGETFRTTFARAGTFRGLCTLHPEGTTTIVVED